MSLRHRGAHKGQGGARKARAQGWAGHRGLTKRRAPPAGQLPPYPLPKACDLRSRACAPKAKHRNLTAHASGALATHKQATGVTAVPRALPDPPETPHTRTRCCLAAAHNNGMAGRAAGLPDRCLDGYITPVSVLLCSGPK